MLRAEARLIFQQRLKEPTLADFAEDTSTPPACLKHEKVATAGNFLSAISEEANDVQDGHDEFPADDEAKANERISVAMELLLEHGVAQGSAAVADDRPNSSTFSGGPIATLKQNLTVHQTPDGVSCTNQVVARHGPSPMPPPSHREIGHGPRVLETTCTVQCQSRFHYKPVRRIVKRCDTSWIRSD
jgi:hypothetical protein